MNAKLILATLATTMIHGASNIQDNIWFIVNERNKSLTRPTHTFDGQPNIMQTVNPKVSDGDLAKLPMVISSEFFQSVESLDALDEAIASDAPKAAATSVNNTAADASPGTDVDSSPAKETERPE
ncbi:MAG: hypothetical protein RLY40_31 [Pseudomonadota bacterium]|jgi:hypothetical protein